MPVLYEVGQRYEILKFSRVICQDGRDETTKFVKG